MKKLFVCCILLSTGIVGNASVEDVFWTGANPGSWMEPSNWTENTTDGSAWYIPGMIAGNPYNDGSWTLTSNKGYAIIQNGTAAIDWNISPYTVPDGRIERIYVSGASNPTLHIVNDASAYKFWVSYNSGDSGVVVQDSGNFSVTRLYLGDSGTGEYTLNDGVLASNGLYSYVGVNGNGILTINDGQAMLDGLYAGYYSGATGTIHVNGGSLTQTTSDEYYFILGYSGGMATLNINDGTVSINDLFAGYNSDSVGVVNMIGGSVSFPGTTHIGENGHGEFYQNAGDVTARKIYLGNQVEGDGIWEISGGSLAVTGFISGGYNQSTFSVKGSGATSIDTQRIVIGDDSVLLLSLDVSGVTPIEVTGNKAIDPNDYEGAVLSGTLKVDTLAGYVGAVGSTYDVLISDTFIDASQLAIESLNMNHTFNYSVVTAGPQQLLRLEEIEGVCGDASHPYPVGDISGPAGAKDCKVDLYDLMELAAHWLECTFDCL